MVTETDRQTYEALAPEVKALIDRVWAAKLAEAQYDAYQQGMAAAQDQLREARAADLCERCGSDVSACFNCLTQVMVGALPGSLPDTTK